MIVFNSQQEFEEAVMDVVLRRLVVRPELGIESTYWVGGEWKDETVISSVDLFDNGDTGE